MRMNTEEARELSKKISTLLDKNQLEEAFNLLSPVLSNRTPFRLIGIIARAAAGNAEIWDKLMDKVAAEGTIGGWPFIGDVLGERLDNDMPAALDRCRTYIIAGNIWHAVDALAERAPGPALVKDFDQALRLLSDWRTDENAWVRRAVGVGSHFWIKRAHGLTLHIPQAKILLDFLEPMFEERNYDAVKGVGWALKTMGRYYPDVAVEWLDRQIFHLKRKPGALMMHKALKLLPAEQRARFIGQ
jgi:3-methyladenine DNA glycosylase AlkD